MSWGILVSSGPGASRGQCSSYRAKWSADVAVFKSDKKIYAINNICPHQKTALMYEGFIEDCNVVCPVHGWEFNLATGKMPDGRRGLDSFETKMVDGFIFVKVIKKEMNW